MQPGGSLGASFVNVDLQVAVFQCRGTAFAFQPARLHGTTIGQGAVNHNITCRFSQRIADAWKEASETEKKVIAGAGTPA